MTVKILDFLKNEWSNWLLADTRGTTLTDFSSFLGWRLKGDSNVTYDPVEKGCFVAYNKTIMPFEGTVTLAKSSKSPDLQSKPFEGLMKLAEGTGHAGSVADQHRDVFNRHATARIQKPEFVEL